MLDIPMCKSIADRLDERYMEIMDYHGDSESSEADSYGTPEKDGAYAIRWLINELEQLKKDYEDV